MSGRLEAVIVGLRRVGWHSPRSRACPAAASCSTDAPSAPHHSATNVSRPWNDRWRAGRRGPASRWPRARAAGVCGPAPGSGRRVTMIQAG